MHVAKTKSPEVIISRRKEEKKDRRVAAIPVASERRKVQRRRQIDPTTCERDYSPEEIEFMHALDDYKRASGRMFPTCSEILEVIKAMGYVKGTPSAALPPSETSTIADLPLLTEA
jgi:hypothetical protein